MASGPLPSLGAAPVRASGSSEAEGRSEAALPAEGAERWLARGSVRRRPSARCLHAPASPAPSSDSVWSTSPLLMGTPHLGKPSRVPRAVVVASSQLSRLFLTSSSAASHLAARDAGNALGRSWSSCFKCHMGTVSQRRPQVPTVASPGHLSRDLFGCHNGGLLPASSLLVEARDATQGPAVHGQPQRPPGRRAGTWMSLLCAVHLEHRVGWDTFE